MPKIMFAVDGSEASLRAARGLAGILRWWKATDVDLICLGTRGMGAVRNLILGSTAAKVLRAVDVPILVVPPAAP